jgi:hypothetical protein
MMPHSGLFDNNYTTTTTTTTDVSLEDFASSTNFYDRTDGKLTERASGSSELVVALQGPAVDLLTDFGRYGKKHSGRVFSDKCGNIRAVVSPVVVFFTSTPAVDTHTHTHTHTHIDR